jgi:hypothetical protein
MKPKTSIRLGLSFLSAILLSHCCRMELDQQCYRQGGSSMVGDLGNTGYRAATTSITKGFQRVSFPRKSRELDVDISEMKLVDTASGNVTASGGAAVSEANKLSGEISTSWDNSRKMVIRIFEFTNPLEIIEELNRDENAQLRERLRFRGDEARIITRVVRAYNHEDIRKQETKGSLDAGFTATNATAKIGVTNNTTTERAVKDGTIVAYQWVRIKWKKDGTVHDIDLYKPLLD